MQRWEFHQREENTVLRNIQNKILITKKKKSVHWLISWIETFEGRINKLENERIKKKYKLPKQNAKGKETLNKRKHKENGPLYCLIFVCVCLVAQLCLTFCDLKDCSLPGSSVHGILQARRLSG